MIGIARRQPPRPRAAVADLRALPFRRSFDLITCLFDSMNFLLTLEDVQRALEACAGALDDHGILYFDIVTERMVTEYFEDQEWIEHNPTFSSRWRSTYDRNDCITETRIRVNRGQESVVRERIYPLSEIRDVLQRAGLTILGAYDARTWRAPTARTVRVDIVASRQPRAPKRYKSVQTNIIARLRDLNY
jgi:SAM-dependent methyltransferase